MRYLKNISILLVLVMVISLIAGCGARGTTTKDEDGTAKTTKDGDVTAKTTKDGDVTTKTTKKETGAGSGSELTDFMTAYMDAKEMVWTKLTDKIEAGSDMTATMALLGFAFTDLAIVFVPMFDSVELTGGILSLAGIKNAYKTRKGDSIEFGYDYTYAEDSGGKKKDDHVQCTGLYDMTQETMKVETIDKSGEGGTNRTVIEITKNKDGSYSSQVISFQSSNDKIQGYFTTFAGEDIWSAIAEKEAAEDFTYNTVFGNKNASLDEMTAGFQVTTNVSFVGGEAKVVTG